MRANHELTAAHRTKHWQNSNSGSGRVCTCHAITLNKQLNLIQWVSRWNWLVRRL